MWLMETIKQVPFRKRIFFDRCEMCDNHTQFINNHTQFQAK